VNDRQKIASPARSPRIRNSAKIARAMKKSHFEIVAAPADIPEKPKSPFGKSGMSVSTDQNAAHSDVDHGS